MTKDEAMLLMIKGAISEMPPDDQAKVNECADKMRGLVSGYCQQGRMVLPALAAVHSRKQREERPAAMMLNRVRCRAKKKGLAFDIDISDIVIPPRCPVLGIPIAVQTGTANDNSAELDRIDNTKGYVKGNVVVVSRRANRIKNDASIAELEAILAFYIGFLAFKVEG
jgi:hypothetical protein